MVNKLMESIIQGQNEMLKFRVDEDTDGNQSFTDDNGMEHYRKNYKSDLSYKTALTWAKEARHRAAYRRANAPIKSPPNPNKVSKALDKEWDKSERSRAYTHPDYKEPTDKNIKKIFDTAKQNIKADKNDPYAERALKYVDDLLKHGSGGINHMLGKNMETIMFNNPNKHIRAAASDANNHIFRILDKDRYK